jgi:hypothetical protein
MVVTAKKTINRIMAWSYSRLRDYKKCPLMAKFKYIDKIPEPENPAMKRGNEIHGVLEQFVTGTLKALPAEVKRHEPLLKDYRKRYKGGKIHVEQQWAFTKEWKATGWFDKDAWCRVKMDVCEDKGALVEGIDHKTGKFRPGEYDDQLFQYCVAMLLRFPDAQEARATLLFHDVEVDKPPTLLLKRQFLAKALEKLEREVTPMLNDTRFAPLPGPHCRWCYQSKHKGGKCKVG